jgi:hypothetical protein
LLRTSPGWGDDAVLSGKAPADAAVVKYQKSVLKKDDDENDCDTLLRFNLWHFDVVVFNAVSSPTSVREAQIYRAIMQFGFPASASASCSA